MPSSLRLSRSQASQQRWVGLLAIFTLLMLFVGPLVSQLQRMAIETSGEELQHHYQRHGHDHQSRSTEPALGHDHGSPQAASEAPDTTVGHHHLAACGYCVLFAQVPWLALLLLVLVTQSPRAPPTMQLASPVLLPSGRFQRPTPRAPPASLS